MLGLLLHIIWIIIVIAIILFLIEIVFGVKFFAVSHDAKQEMDDVMHMSKMIISRYKNKADEKEKSAKLSADDEERDVQVSSSDFSLNLSKPKIQDLK